MMEMIQTYQGHFQAGRFIPLETAAIPENVEVYVVVTEKSVPLEKPKAQRQREAINRFFSAIDAIEDESITDEDLAVLERNRVNFHRELGV